MNTYQVEIMPDALVEIREQTKFIAADNPRAAEAWLGRLLHSIADLSVFPHRNPVSKEYTSQVGDEIRQIVFGNYLVIYHINEVRQVVEVARFRHASRLPESVSEPNLDSDD